MATPQESILSYTQPAAPAAAYYSAPPSVVYYGEERGSGSRSLTLALSVLLLLFVIWFLYYMSPARVLTRNLIKTGWVLYTMPGCGHCTRQKNILKGKFWKYVSCRGGRVVGGYTLSPPIKCSDAKITGFPYWYNTKRPNQSRSGVQSWSQLRAMAKMN